MVRVELPYHLRVLAGVEGDLQLDVTDATLGGAIEALETRCPALRNTIRDQKTGQRRPLVRFFVSGEDWSDAKMETMLPAPVRAGDEPLIVVGAIAGG